MISGASGFVGQALIKFLSDKGLEVYPIYHSSRLEEVNATFCDFQDYVTTAKIIKDTAPDVFVHCAALTNVDVCESKKVDCWNANVNASMNICRSMDKKIHFVYVSTSQVFDGKNGNYNEESIKNPINWYGTTKSISEELVMNILSSWTLVRFSNLYGFDPKCKNFFHNAVVKLLRNEKINAAGDNIISPTYINTALSALSEIILKRIYGIYHIADLESSTKYDMLVKLSKILGKTGLVLKQQSSSIFSAKRPPNTSLDVSKFSDSLNQSKPMTLNQGLSKFVRKVRTSLGENCSKQEP
jgi:dTDP-4-dehydrorhamnose reductase